MSLSHSFSFSNPTPCNTHHKEKLSSTEKIEADLPTIKSSNFLVSDNLFSFLTVEEVSLTTQRLISLHKLCIPLTCSHLLRDQSFSIHFHLLSHQFLWLHCIIPQQISMLFCSCLILSCSYIPLDTFISLLLFTVEHMKVLTQIYFSSSITHLSTHQAWRLLSLAFQWNCS
jgi:hypothetical protein